VKPAAYGAHLVEGVGGEGADAAQRLLDGRGRIGKLAVDDFELNADGGEKLSDAGVELAAEALALALDLADGASSGASAEARGGFPELAFNGLKAHKPLQEAVFQLDEDQARLAGA
jgi:hypothetical protein